MIIMGVMMNRQLFQQKRQQRQEKLCGLIIKSLNQKNKNTLHQKEFIFHILLK